MKKSQTKQSNLFITSSAKRSRVITLTKDTTGGADSTTRSSMTTLPSGSAYGNHIRIKDNDAFSKPCASQRSSQQYKKADALSVSQLYKNKTSSKQTPCSRSTAVNSSLSSSSYQISRNMQHSARSTIDSSQDHTNSASRFTKRPKAAATQSAYFTKCQATKKTADFWGKLTLMAEKAGKIERIDGKNKTPCPLAAADIPATSIDTRPRAPKETLVISHLRGQGGLKKEMNGVVKRDPREEHHEHVLEGRSMNVILQPDSLP